MVGHLDQLIALASAANAVIAGLIEPADFYPAHKTFQGCNRVEFVTVKRQHSNTRESVFAADPEAWLARLHGDLYTRVGLELRGSCNEPLADHVAAAFSGGGGDWSMIAAGPTKLDRWMSRWEATDQQAADRKIWSVTYGLVETRSKDTAPAAPDLAKVKARLYDALVKIAAFAARQKLDGWRELFQRGAASMDSRRPMSGLGYHGLVRARAYPLEARQLFAAASHGWVFGGMGSWNDLGFERGVVQRKYEQLSAVLYAAIIEAIEAAVNSFAG